MMIRGKFWYLDWILQLEEIGIDKIQEDMFWNMRIA